MAVVFNYAVKYNGKYYTPNTPIDEPVEDKGPAAASEASEAAAPQEATEAHQSDSNADPTANTFDTEKAQEKERAARQRVRKGKGDAK